MRPSAPDPLFVHRGVIARASVWVSLALALALEAPERPTRTIHGGKGEDGRELISPHMSWVWFSWPWRWSRSRSNSDGFGSPYSAATLQVTETSSWIKCDEKTAFGQQQMQKGLRKATITMPHSVCNGCQAGKIGSFDLCSETLETSSGKKRQAENPTPLGDERWLAFFPCLRSCVSAPTSCMEKGARDRRSTCVFGVDSKLILNVWSFVSVLAAPKPEARTEQSPEKNADHNAPTRVPKQATALKSQYLLQSRQAVSRWTDSGRTWIGVRKQFAPGVHQSLTPGSCPNISLKFFTSYIPLRVVGENLPPRAPYADF